MKTCPYLAFGACPRAINEPAAAPFVGLMCIKPVILAYGSLNGHIQGFHDRTSVPLLRVAIFQLVRLP